MKYRLIPRVFDAIQWNVTNYWEVVNFMTAPTGRALDYELEHRDGMHFLGARLTPSAEMFLLSKGEWLVRAEDGTYDVISESDFQSCYEPDYPAGVK